jgi:hypothetical protein
MPTFPDTPLAALRRRFPDWTITYNAYDRCWYAEYRYESAIRILAAYDPTTLAAKIEAAQEETDG